MTILCVAGARPNFVKIAPVLAALEARALDAQLVHTGQHYDARMSDVFFRDLDIRAPDFSLDVGSGSHAVQTAAVLERFERLLKTEQPHVVLVVGDVNSTLAAALATAKFQLDHPFACALGTRRRPILVHVEAGLRSFDDDMPEEVNRRLTDAISDVLLVSEEAGMQNLAAEGVAPARCFFVGNVMIDSLLAVRARAQESDILERLGVAGSPYGLVTLHRPNNVDEGLGKLLATLDDVSRDLPLVLPAHPRMRAKLDAATLSGRWIVTEPLGYLEFVQTMSKASVVLTDSGGVQEETTVLGVPCLTLRTTTERPATIDEGTNELVGTKRADILAAFARVMNGARKPHRVPCLWDGAAAPRAAQVIESVL